MMTQCCHHLWLLCLKEPAIVGLPRCRSYLMGDSCTCWPVAHEPTGCGYGYTQTTNHYTTQVHSSKVVYTSCNPQGWLFTNHAPRLWHMSQPWQPTTQMTTDHLNINATLPNNNNTKRCQPCALMHITLDLQDWPPSLLPGKHHEATNVPHQHLIWTKGWRRSKQRRRKRSRTSQRRGNVALGMLLGILQAN